MMVSEKPEFTTENTETTEITKCLCESQFERLAVSF